jgi:hypothetical protein
MKTDTRLPPEDSGPVLDQPRNQRPWPDDILPVDDDGNVLPGADEIDDDPNDNGDLAPDDLADFPADLPDDPPILPVVRDEP